MNNILVCFSMTPNTDDVIRTEWEKAGREDFALDCVSEIVNVYDEAAIEYALRIKDDVLSDGGAASIAALCMGRAPTETVYKNLFAVGVDRVVYAETETDGLHDPSFAAATIASFCDGTRYDAILLGQQNCVSCGGQTAARLAMRLHMPLVSYVQHVQWENGALHAVCRMPGGTQSADVLAPAVFAFYNTEHPYLRMATLRERLRVKDRQLERALLVSSAPRAGVALQRLSYMPHDRQCRMLEGDTPQKKAATFLQTYIAAGGKHRA